MLILAPVPSRAGRQEHLRPALVGARQLSRDIEQVSRLLRRQPGMDRHKRHRLAARHLLKDIEEP